MAEETDDLMIPQDLRFTKEHIWIRTEGERVRVGVTEFFLESMGHIMSVDLAEKGTLVDAATEIAVITGNTSGAVEVYAPLDGKVLKINESLYDEPDLLVSDPYDEGWLCVLSGVEEDEIDNLLTPEDYQDDLSDL